ncbi:phospholipase D-like domain-containing protein [Cyclobacterium sp. SYSU L10401]|uniref:phospholipase D-like domain-containing protein n=1 Tax=Cyclobacterium sp. SYSU L10401 TaxID=2678657 RepID=UPI0013D436D9|nr:phospholipase D-like domain-containing protein [Cyclobacterium sp. SYSU L10401]
MNQNVNQTTLNSKIEYFVEGVEYFQHLTSSIQKTTRKGDFIYILGWMLDINFNLVPDDESTKLSNLLLNAVKQGVAVRVLLWDNPLYYKKNIYAINFLNELAENNKKFDVIALTDNVVYRPLVASKAIASLKSKLPIPKNWFGDLFIELLTSVIDLPSSLAPIKKLFAIDNVASHHEKVVLIQNADGLRAYCGGMDINKNRLFSQFDVQCCIHSDGAEQIFKKFSVRWKGIEYKWNNNPLTRHFKLPKIYFPQAMYNPDNNNEYPMMGVIGTYNTPKNFRKNINDRTAKRTLLAIIENTKDYIYIEDQYIISLEIAKALHKALRKGLKKLIILTQDSELAKPDLIFPYRARRKFYQTLKYGRIPNRNTLEKTSSIAEFDKKVRVYQIAPAHKQFYSWREVVHSKLLIADDEIMTMGSFNCNYRSLEVDSETGIVIYEPNKDSVFSIRNFKRKLFSRYYLGPLRNDKEIADLMEDPFNWPDVTITICPLNFFGEDKDIEINKFLRAYAARESKMMDEASKNPKYDQLSNIPSLNIIEKCDELAKYTLTKEFEDLVWDIVEAHYGPKNL